MAKTFRDIIALWPAPSVTSLAGDLREDPDTVRKWRERNRIPSSYWKKILRAARRRSLKLSEQDLVRIAAA